MKPRQRDGARSRAAQVAVLLLGLLLVLTAILLTTQHAQRAATELRGESGVRDSLGAELTSGEVYPMPAGMLFSSPSLQSETAGEGVTITATLRPETATNKLLDWHVEFEDPASVWAEGKTVTDYATVTPESDGSTRATVVCLQAFGEPIRVVATSRKYTDVSAVCKLDYLSRVENAELTMRRAGEPAETLDIDYAGTEYVFGVENVEWGLGTVQPEYTETNFEISWTNEFREWILEHTELDALDIPASANDVITSIGETVSFVSSLQEMQDLYHVAGYDNRAEFNKGYAGYTGPVIRVRASITNGLGYTNPNYVSYWGTVLDVAAGTVDTDTPLSEIELDPPSVVF